MMSLDGLRAGGRRPPDAAAWASLWSRVAPHVLIPADGKTERRMVLVQWLIMPLVLAGCLLPWPRVDEHLHVMTAAAIMLLHPLCYILLARLPVARGDLRDFALTATDVTVATLVYYLTPARPGYAQVLLYCVVALAATRYPLHRALGIASLVALLLLFAALLPLRVALPTLAGAIIGLYALTGLVGLLSHAEKEIGRTAAENAELAQTVLRRNRELGVLNRLSRTLNTLANGQDAVRLGLAGMAEALELHNLRAYFVENGVVRLSVQRGNEGDTSEAAEGRKLHEATRALVAGHTVIKGWYVSEREPLLTPGPLLVSIPLCVHGAVAAIVQAQLPPAPPAVSDALLETIEVFCGEIAVALENVALRGEAHRTAILQEKNRIAQELHDTVLQMLFSIGLRLQWSLEHLPVDPAVGGPLEGPLAEARHLSARAGEELRGAIFTLSSEIAEIGLIAAVGRLVEEQAAKAAWSAKLLTSGDVPGLPVLVQNAAHRVVRESLMNAYKHASASEVMVSMRFGVEMITVVVQDNGVGIPHEKLGSYRQMPDHFGLRTVAEQVERLGGELAVFNNDDEPGTTVRAVIPLHGVVSSQ